MSVNKVILVGNLGSDPRSKTSEDGSTITNLRIATHERWTDRSGQRQERTEWHTVVIVAPKLAELASRYLKRGRAVYVEGQLRTRRWTDRSGNEQTFTEVVVNNSGNLVFLDRVEPSETVVDHDVSGPSQQTTARPVADKRNAPKPEPADSGDFWDDEIPF